MKYLIVEYDKNVAILTLNDPERRNIISQAIVDELDVALDEIERHANINTVIITGAGSTFCAGADLTDLKAASEGDQDGLKRIYQGFLRIANCTLPTVAAVNGHAVGAGLNLALACDVRVAAQSAQFDTRFLDLGLHPGGGHTWMLHRALGWQSAAAMLLFSQKIDGENAAELGLAWKCVPDEELMPEALRLAKRADAIPLELMRRTKHSLRNSSAVNDHNHAVEFELEHQLWSMQQPEFQQLLGSMQSKISGRNRGATS